MISPEDMRAAARASDFLDKALALHRDYGATVSAAQEEARQKGFREGFDKGRTEALGELIDAVERVRQRLAASDEELAGIVLAAVEQILGTMEESELALRCVRRAIEEASAEVWVSLRVCPEDLARIEEGLRALPLDPSWPEIKAVEPDPLLKAGETILETPKGRIHVGLQQQLSRLKAGLQNLEG